MKYIAVKAIEKKDNYLHPRFKYRNKYNLYTTNDDKYNNISKLQITKKSEDK